MVIADTTIWVDHLRGVRNAHTNWLNRELDGQPIGMIDLILCETLQGVRRDENITLIQAKLSPFNVFNTGGADLAIEAAYNYRLLRARGYTVRKTIDCIIAPFCIRAGFALLHRDRDFDAFESNLGLRVIHPEPPQ